MQWLLGYISIFTSLVLRAMQCLYFWHVYLGSLIELPHCCLLLCSLWHVLLASIPGSNYWLSAQNVKTSIRLQALGMHRRNAPYARHPFFSGSHKARIPDVKATLDNWHNKPYTSGEYNNIFDGKMYQVKLKAPDSSLFFFNHFHEKNGPNKKPWISVNLDLDWFLLHITSSSLTNAYSSRFFYICSNIALSHSSCPVSFSICNLPSEFQCVILHYSLSVIIGNSRYCMPNLLCTSIIPSFKEQSPDEIQWFLYPIVSDLLCLWKDGIMVPMKSSPCGKPFIIMWCAGCCFA